MEFYLDIVVTLQCVDNGTAHIFAFLYIIEGITENALQFTMPLESIYNENLCFVEQKM
jgi:hypothetical protein